MAVYYKQIILRLDKAIPPDELEALKPYVGTSGDRPASHPTGGNVYHLDHPEFRVASYNNTRKDEAEIIAWYERALLLT